MSPEGLAPPPFHLADNGGVHNTALEPVPEASTRLLLSLYRRAGRSHPSGDNPSSYDSCESLWRQGVRVVFTSNQPPAGLYQGSQSRTRHMGPLSELLRRRCVSIRLGEPEATDEGGLDYRRHDAARHSEAHGTRGRAPSALLTEVASFEAAWEAAAASGPAARRSVGTGFGRSVEVLAAGEAACRISFAELCGDGSRGSAASRGAADYYALARTFSRVFVDGGPRLGSRRDEDEARRLIALVDVLYDEGVGLVLRCVDRGAASTADDERIAWARACARRDSNHRRKVLPYREGLRSLVGPS